MPATLSSTRSSPPWPAIRTLTPKGEMLLANGVDLPARHDGLTAALENAGILYRVGVSGTNGPTQTVPVGSFAMAQNAGAGTNISTGTYYAAVRFLDDEGIPGDLSALISLAVSGSNRNQLDYTAVPVTPASGADSRITQRQIFRSTVNQNKVLYLDQTIADTSTTTATSQLTDTLLSASTNTILQINSPDGGVNARRFGRPPDYMRVVANHFDRTFWGVPAIYKVGNASVTNGNANVTLIGGVVTLAMAGRTFKVPGDAVEYTISYVNTSTNVLVLSTTYTGSTDAFASYSVYPPKSEWNKVYWSYAGEPESVYSDTTVGDAIVLEADHANEETLTGLVRFASFLYLTTKSNIYRWSFTGDPFDTGAIYHTEDRGLLNQRCWARVENQLAMMDREGIYLFNGGNANPISEQIQDYFRDKIRWEQSEWFHAVTYQAEETVKFFVCLDGSYYPKHSLCFHYRTNRWWVEEYPWEIASSAVVPVASKKTMLLGSEHESVLMPHGLQDLRTQDRVLGTRYDVSSANIMSVTLSSPDWIEADVQGGTVCIVSGRGKGQMRRILTAGASNGKIEIDRPWNILPDSTSDAVVGGVHWLWATKTFEVDSDSSEPKQISVVVDPTDNANNLDFKFYQNHSTTALVAEGSNTNQSGAFSTDADSRIELPLKKTRPAAGTMASMGDWDGNGWWRFDDAFDLRGPAARYVQCEMEGYVGKDEVVVHAVDVGGVM